MSGAQTIPAILQAKRQLAADAIELTLQCDQPFDFIPGQFVKIGFSYQDKILQRSYSLASAPNGKQLEIAIAGVSQGRATDFFFSAQQGTQVSVTGPYGFLTLPIPLPKRLFLVATGSGVAPYRAMLSQLANELVNSESEVYLLFGCRYAADVLYADEFSQFAVQYSQFHYQVILSRDAVANHPNAALHGRVQQQLAQYALDKNDHFLLCGNPDMVDELFTSLRGQGFGVKQVRREKYVFSS